MPYPFFTLQDAIHRLDGMAADYDATEFIDGDFQRQKSPYGAAQPAQATSRAPTREEVDARVADAQAKLSELKRAQEQLERERAALEETRRRQAEFQRGRGEMIQNLTRGLGLLEESEFSARRDAEQMAKSLAELKDALAKVQAIQEDSWSKENFEVQLTQALTTLENARMEWNSARLKFPVLSSTPASEQQPDAPQGSFLSSAREGSFSQIARYGLALTWPVAVAVLLAGAMIAIILLQR